MNKHSSGGRSDDRPSLRKAIRTALKRAGRKLEKLTAECQTCESAEVFREQGEILKANLQAFQRGDGEVTLPDLYDPGKTRTIELQPHLKPLDNAKRYFKQYRKATKGKEAKERERDLCAEEKEGLAALLADFDTWMEDAEEGDDLPEAVLEQARKLRVNLPRPATTGRDRIDPAATGIRSYTSLDGLTILVGKGAKDNDRLSLKLAKGNDWWFHVHQYAGSHVVVRMPGSGGKAKMANKKRKQDALALPQETLLDAAHLAAWFSKARGATKVEVSYTQAKHLHKRKGAPAGQVILNQSKSIYVKIEKKRLNRLLERH